MRQTRRELVGSGAEGLFAGAGLTAALAGKLSGVTTARGRLPGVIFLGEVGATGDGKTDDTDAIRAALKRARSWPAGGVVVAPPGTYRTRGMHMISPRVQLLGCGVGATTFQHVGRGPCFVLTGPGVTEQRIGVADCSIHGNDAPTAVGVEFRDVSFGAWARNVRIRDFPAGTGFLLNNQAPGQFTEGVMLLGCSSSNNRTAVAFRRGQGTESFKAFYTQQFGCNVPAFGTGFDFGVGAKSQILVYNCHIHAHVWFNRNERNVGWDVGETAILREGQAWVSGEGSSRTSISIRNRKGGHVSLFGQWWFNQIPHDADLARTRIGPFSGSATLGAA